MRRQCFKAAVSKLEAEVSQKLPHAPIKRAMDGLILLKQHFPNPGPRARPSVQRIPAPTVSGMYCSAVALLHCQVCIFDLVLGTLWAVAPITWLAEGCAARRRGRHNVPECPRHQTGLKMEQRYSKAVKITYRGDSPNTGSGH